MIHLFINSSGFVCVETIWSFRAPLLHWNIELTVATVGNYLYVWRCVFSLGLDSVSGESKPWKIYNFRYVLILIWMRQPCIICPLYLVLFRQFMWKNTVQYVCCWVFIQWRSMNHKRYALSKYSHLLSLHMTTCLFTWCISFICPKCSSKCESHKCL